MTNGQEAAFPKGEAILLKHLNALLDMAFEQTNCPDCLVEYNSGKKCKRGCRVWATTHYLIKRANGKS